MVARLGSFGKLLSAPLAPGYFQIPLDADVVHLHLPNPFAELHVLFSLWRTPELGRRLAPFVHALPVGQGLLGRIWFRLVTEPILARARQVIVSNSSVLGAFPQLLRWSDKTSVLGFVSPSASAVAHGRGGYILCLGRLVGYKGFDILLRAHARLAQDTRPQLWIAGEGPERSRLELLAADLGLQAHVRFLGEIEEGEKGELFAGALFFAAPSLTNAETFGIAILEAMAAGLAVVTTDLRTGVAELARGGECGAVVPPGDDRALATAITDLLRDKARRATAAAANSAYATANYGRASLERAYEELLKQFIL